MTAISVERMVQSLRAREKVFVSGSAGEPRALTECIASRPDLAVGVEFFCSFIPGVNVQNLAGEGRTMTVSFMQGAYRKGLAARQVKFAPMSYSNTQQQLCTPGAIDTVLVQVSPPNELGWCSLGPQGEFLPGLLKNRPRVLAVFNPQVPVFPGAPKIRLADIDAYCESDLALASYDAGKPNSVSERIAENIAAIIPDGATLQCGLGKVPNLLAKALGNHRHLRIHSGMASDGMSTLLAAGALDSAAPITSIVALGSPGLYGQLADIDGLTICGVEDCHTPQALAGVPRLHAVNSALEIDLSGQVNAEMLGGRYVSGRGGLPDFAAGARAQQLGCSIIALPAADPSGEQSRIVAQLAVGSAISVPQYLVDVVVTEYGCAHLRGADFITRGRRLIEIAHPNHRDRLAAEFEHRWLR